jgi:hypothetical protein
VAGVVDGANRNDMKLTEAALACLLLERTVPTQQNPQGLCLNKGYDDPDVRQMVAGLGFTSHMYS